MAGAGTRVRGVSFKKEYARGAQPSTFQKFKNKVTGRGRAPSMISEPAKAMLPAQASGDQGKLCVVFDLDETLIYAREGPLYSRPGLDELLEWCDKRTEPVVWTAGVRAYAQAVCKNIDKKQVIRHCVYRHKKWFSGCAGYNKDLTLLGRDMSKLVILENTPDCVRGNEGNGIVVADYEADGSTDTTLPAILQVLQDMVEQIEKRGVTVPQYITSTPLLTKQHIPTDIGDMLVCYCLDTATFQATKATRVNRDLAK